MKIAIVVILLILVLFIIYLSSQQQKVQSQLTIPYASPQKKVILIIVDSLMNEPLQKAITEDKAPAMKYLINNGRYYPKVVSSYPTMSVTIDSTLLTGTYSDQHKVPALVWYDEKEKRFISYGSDKKEILKLGPKQVLQNSLSQLNEKQLSDQVKTIHEELDENGLQSASINALIFRGNRSHKLQVPRLMQFFRFLKKDAPIKGATYFSYGLLSKINPENTHTHLWNGFGFNDKFATEEMKYLIEKDRVPSFSLVYFSDNDKKVHKKGVNETKGIEEADKKLQSLFNSYGSWEEALKDNIWMVMGDSGQTHIKGEKEAALIDLRKLLNGYKIYRINKPIQKDDQIVLGLNERMSFIYTLDNTIKHESLARQLQSDDRIDTIAWREGNTVNVISGTREEELSFRSNGKYTDTFGQSWDIEGDPQALDLSINKDGLISYGDYPDALARLYSSFYSHTGSYIIANTKPGYEFIGEGSPTHVGGASHGSLHEEDSFFPIIVSGTDLEPEHLRMVDVKEWIMRMLKG
ncbi:MULTISPECIES: alkaline phosphatase family protein [Bacillus]|nr:MULTISPECIES: alkaline phosphatase family protein [Bacillus]MBP1079656.1 putative AlkP superfamily pyrophosphatase or phosphodiesterase [Bacillus capparidis]